MSSTSTQSTRALVVAAGPGPEVDTATTHLDDVTLVVAADGGLDLANTLGIDVDVVIGDLDSVTSEALQRARSAGIDIIEFPVDKDNTDLELALEHCLHAGVTEVVIIGAGGGRVDHELANVQLICAPRWSGLEITAVDDRGRLLPINGSRTLPVSPGALVTLLAVGGPARGIRTSGFRWELDGDTLIPGSTRGVSNVAITSSPEVSLDDGCLLGVIPWDAPA